MAAAGGGKKKGKKKGKTLNLNEFLGSDTSQVFVAPSRKVDWAEESGELGPIDDFEEWSGPQPKVNLAKLPSAPRSSRGVDIDLSRLPSQPPYTAFLGNLPFDVTEEDIRTMFNGLKVENIRFPQEQGRMKGFGYAEFFSVDELKSALALTGEKVRTRQIRVDIADHLAGSNRGGFGDRGDDRTTNDWRRGGDESSFGRMDNRRGGGDMRDGGFRRPPDSSSADSEDCWRRSAPQPPPSNGFDQDRGGRRFENRNDTGWGERPGFERRNYNDERRGFDDDRRGGFRDDNRGYRDDRRGFGDDRRGYRDGRGGFDRGGFDRGGPRDDNWGPRGDRGDIRRSDESSDEKWQRGSAVVDRTPPQDLNTSVEDSDSPKPIIRKETEDVAQPKSSGSVFGGARPVDTAAKEREIEEKLQSEKVTTVTRGRGEDRRRDSDRESSQDRMISPGRERFISPNRDRDNFKQDRQIVQQEDRADSIDNWRNDRPLQDATVDDKNDMPLERKGNIDSRGRGRGAKNIREKKKKDGPVSPPKYEEPEKPVFVHSSKFAALGIEDDGEENSGSDIECP